MLRLERGVLASPGGPTVAKARLGVGSVIRWRHGEYSRMNENQITREDQLSQYGTVCLLFGFLFGVWIGLAVQPSAAVAGGTAPDRAQSLSR